jgi:hypothetical protein
MHIQNASSLDMKGEENLIILSRSFTRLFLCYCRNRTQFDLIQIVNLSSREVILSEIQVAILVYWLTLKLCI